MICGSGIAEHLKLGLSEKRVGKLFLLKARK